MQFLLLCYVGQACNCDLYEYDFSSSVVIYRGSVLSKM